MYKFHFPKDFIIGTATAAYQIEGGREHLDRCIWDDFAKIPGKVHNFDDGSVACDSYNRVDEDIEILKQLKVKAYRFSICLTRVINKNGEVLQDGINYYKRLIRKLKDNQIMPFVTLYHWDLPSYLQLNGGWANDETVNWYINYCKVIFESFKNEVSFYITINEPFCVAQLGYGYGCHAPGISDEKYQMKVSLNLLKAHGLAVKLYKELGYAGKIGLGLNINDLRAHGNTPIEKINFFKNKGMWWYFYPIATGQFDQETFAYFKEKGLIDEISENDYRLMTTMGDFIGLNHYNPEFLDENENSVRHEEFEVNGLGWHVDSTSIYNVIKEMSLYTDAEIYILENGYGSKNIDDVNKEIHDEERVNYYKEYLIQVNKLVDEGINVKGYFAWSLLDNYEWGMGYSIRFGIVHVDYKTLKRTIKDSGYFIRDLCEQTYKKKLVFIDEFQGNKLDKEKWNVVVAGNGFGNNEFQYYLDSDENIIVNNGLKIKAIKKKHENREYTSAKLTSIQTFKYGHFEILCKVPKGKGSWPAVWMMPTDRTGGWPMCGEIDIVETVGRNQDVMHFSLHTGKYNHMYNTQRTKFLHVQNASDEYKLYSMDWTKDFINFYIDGILYVRFDRNDKKFPGGIESWPFDKEFYLICNLAVGGNWGGEVDESALPFEFDIKSIKVYEWED